MDTKQSLPSTQTLRLAEDLPVILIHGITGQEVAEQTLEAGAYLSAWLAGEDSIGQRYHLFLGSLDGNAWYRYQSYGDPKTEAINPKFEHCEDGDGQPITTRVSRGPKPSRATRKQIR